MTLPRKFLQLPIRPIFLAALVAGSLLPKLATAQSSFAERKAAIAQHSVYPLSFGGGITRQLSGPSNLRLSGYNYFADYEAGKYLAAEGSFESADSKPGAPTQVTSSDLLFGLQLRAPLGRVEPFVTGHAGMGWMTLTTASSTQHNPGDCIYGGVAGLAVLIAPNLAIRATYESNRWMQSGGTLLPGSTKVVGGFDARTMHLITFSMTHRFTMVRHER